MAFVGLLSLAGVAVGWLARDKIDLLLGSGVLATIDLVLGILMAVFGSGAPANVGIVISIVSAATVFVVSLLLGGLTFIAKAFLA